MRWTRWRRPTSGAVADGEAVWSWRRDAGAKLAEDDPPATVAKEPVHRGDHGISVKPIAQGMPVISAEPVVPAPCLLAARGPWVRLKHSAFPAPSASSRVILWQRSDESVARMRTHVLRCRTPSAVMLCDPSTPRLRRRWRYCARRSFCRGGKRDIQHSRDRRI
jgi:hypothetical protein